MTDFNEIAIIGWGLMGGSLAMALRDRTDCLIYGYDSSPDVMISAQKMNLLDRPCESAKEAAAGADLVVLATPVGAYGPIFREIHAALKPDSIITDMGSVKRPALEMAKNAGVGDRFIGGHPLAGSEKGGLEAATPYLFENAYFFVTPASQTLSTKTARLKTWISMLGAFPVIVSAEEHDQIMAKTSHFPHVVASMVAVVLAEQPEQMLPAFTGSGFRDTTRIASGNPVLWEEILHLNRQEVIRCLEQMEKKSAKIREALAKKEREWIKGFLEAGKQFRDDLPKAGKDYLPAWYELYVDIRDEPGALAAITSSLASALINIREIEILHAREGEKGAVRLAFASSEEEQLAMKVLGSKGHSFARSKGEKSHA